MNDMIATFGAEGPVVVPPPGLAFDLGPHDASSSGCAADGPSGVEPGVITARDRPLSLLEVLARDG